MVLILFMMIALCVADTAVETVARFVRWVKLPRYRWNRGGQYKFN